MHKTARRFGRGAAALALVTALTAPATPAGAQAGRFNGGGVVFGYTEPCRTAGMLRATQAFTVMYQPRMLGSNGTRESLAFIAPWGALTYWIDGARFNGNLVPVTIAGLFHGHFTIPRTDPNAPQLRVTSLTPSTLSASLRTPVRMTGDIQNWSGVRGCNVRFEVLVGQDIP